MRIICICIVFAMASIALAQPTREEVLEFIESFRRPQIEANLAIIEAQLKANPQLVHGVDGRLRNTPLHVAVSMRLRFLSELLLRYGADANAVNGEQETPTSLASKHYPNLLHAMLNYGANFNGPISMLRVVVNDWELVFLLENGLDPSGGVPNRWYLESSKWILFGYGVDLPSAISGYENDLRTILLNLAANGHAHEVEQITLHRANDLTFSDCLEALKRAVARGRTSTCDVLLEGLLGRNKSAEENKEFGEAMRRMLRSATMNKNVQIVASLLHAGAEIDAAFHWVSCVLRSPQTFTKAEIAVYEDIAFMLSIHTPESKQRTILSRVLRREIDGPLRRLRLPLRIPSEDAAAKAAL